MLYTLVENARANELDVYEYLKYLLIEMPNNHHLEDPIRYRQPTALVKRAARAVPFKKEQKKVPQTLM